MFFEKDGVLHFVKAKHDVILSAGSFASAQLLMVSGIGPKKHLQDLGVHTFILHRHTLYRYEFANILKDILLNKI